MSGRVVSVSAKSTHSLSKHVVPCIVLLEGLGVEGDAHCGATVKHRSRVRQDPTQPNLRQVRLLQAELFDELASRGFHAAPGQLGENITTRGLNLLALPVDTELRIGAAVVRLTGLRNPCTQLDDFQPGLMAAVGGAVAPGDAIDVVLSPLPHVAMDRV